MSYVSGIYLVRRTCGFITLHIFREGNDHREMDARRIIVTSCFSVHEDQRHQDFVQVINLSMRLEQN